MSTDRPQFRRGSRPPPEVRGRVAAMAVMLLLACGMLLARAFLAPADAGTRDLLVVEVRGDVPAPGFHALEPPARVHAALREAGLDPSPFVDARLEPGTRLVVEGSGLRLEPMDQLLVVGLPIDLNQASATALQAIPGLGERRAADIVADRQQNGPYATIEDLDRVKGIGPATIEKLRPFVRVEAP